MRLPVCGFALPGASKQKKQISVIKFPGLATFPAALCAIARYTLVAVESNSRHKMTTGHFNPGYGDIISTLRRAKSAGPGMAVGSKSFRETVDYRSDPLLLEHIRSQARETWSKPSVFQTSYDDQFNNKIVEMGEATRARPTSTQRRNKPHPPL